MTDTSVKFFHSDMQGAPALTGAAGSLVGLLDAVLNSGFGVRTITAATITAGVCTLTFSSSIAQDVDSVVLVAGCTPASGTINGEQKVTASSTTTISFATTATGTVTLSSPTVKVAPLNWNIAYTGTNLRAYKPSDPMASGCLIRFDDTQTLFAKGYGYESMSDISTGVGQFPTVARATAFDGSLTDGGLRWYKDAQGTSTTIPWMVFGDSRGFFFCPALYRQSGVGNQMSPAYYFGDFLPQRSGDAWACYHGATGTSPSGGWASSSASAWGATPSGFAPRSYSGLTGAINLGRAPAACQSDQWNSGDNNWTVAYPNGPDNGLVLAQQQLYELFGTATSGNSRMLRGKFPGMLVATQSLGINFQNRTVVQGTGDFSGRRLMSLRASASLSTTVTDTSNGGSYFMDITGPWR